VIVRSVCRLAPAMSGCLRLPVRLGLRSVVRLEMLWCGSFLRLPAACVCSWTWCGCESGAARYCGALCFLFDGLLICWSLSSTWCSCRNCNALLTAPFISSLSGYPVLLCVNSDRICGFLTTPPLLWRGLLCLKVGPWTSVLVRSLFKTFLTCFSATLCSFLTANPILELQFFCAQHDVPVRAPDTQFTCVIYYVQYRFEDL